ncbi:hypothetical protein J8273_1043 [Carpediemonas membranifera]|uniref:Uncharacterized protein n=1 Tax=Carpediemonas membranifera TaxID=201153 RepID=A0A8J6E236_9EUKA|nr:hypothetical protein J8273_1043 [Carpediemonas membranifera]|eukprot:KAG9397134.1 hypothetical protein J8273_1043 [Carpediemonas membranifera]
MDNLNLLLAIEETEAAIREAGEALRAENNELRILEKQVKDDALAFAHEVEVRLEVLEEDISMQRGKLAVMKEENQGICSVLPPDPGADIERLEAQLEMVEAERADIENKHEASVIILKNTLTELQAEFAELCPSIAHEGLGRPVDAAASDEESVEETEDDGTTLYMPELPYQTAGEVEDICRQFVRQFHQDSTVVNSVEKNGKVAREFDFGGVEVTLPKSVKFVLGTRTVVLFQNGDCRLVDQGLSAHVFTAHGLVEIRMDDGTMVLFPDRVEWRSGDRVIVEMDGKRREVVLPG